MAFTIVELSYNLNDKDVSKDIKLEDITAIAMETPYRGEVAVKMRNGYSFYVRGYVAMELSKLWRRLATDNLPVGVYRIEEKASTVKTIELANKLPQTENEV